jgi:hypothetical protein
MLDRPAQLLRADCTYLESLLFAWCDPRPPCSQVACKLTSPYPFPPHSNFPSPQGFPKSVERPSKTTSLFPTRLLTSEDECKWF